MLQYHLEDWLKFRSPDDNVRDSDSVALGWGSWDMHLNRSQSPFGCRWPIDYHLEKPSRDQVDDQPQTVVYIRV